MAAVPAQEDDVEEEEVEEKPKKKAPKKSGKEDKLKPASGKKAPKKVSMIFITPVLHRLIVCHAQDANGDEVMGDAEGGDEESGKKRKVVSRSFAFLHSLNMSIYLESSAKIRW